MDRSQWKIAPSTYAKASVDKSVLEVSDFVAGIKHSLFRFNFEPAVPPSRRLKPAATLLLTFRRLKPAATLCSMFETKREQIRLLPSFFILYSLQLWCCECCLIVVVYLTSNTIFITIKIPSAWYCFFDILTEPESISSSTLCILEGIPESLSI